MTHRVIQIYRGTKAQNDAFTGAVGELTMDTTNNELRLHDGTTVGGHKIGGGIGYIPDLFDTKWADHEINDMAWLRSDTFSWQDGTVYSNAYNHLVDDVDALKVTAWSVSILNVGAWARYPDADRTGQSHPYAFRTRVSSYTYEYVYSDVENPAVNTDYLYDGYTSGASSIGYPNYAHSDTVLFPFFETIAGTTITYHPATDGHKICLPDQESNVASIYNATGVAWYYILDTANTRFKLPRSKHEHYGNRPVAGNGKSVCYTNGSGTDIAILSRSGTASPATDVQTGGYTGTLGNITETAWYNGELGITTDSTKSGMISTPIQDTDQYKYLYFYVGQFSQSATEQTAGLNASLFNNKVDLDAGNLNAVGKSVISGLPMPSTNNIALTLGASGASYTAPANGWVSFGAFATTQAGCVVLRNDYGLRVLTTAGNGGNATIQVIMPVKKGSTFYAEYDSVNFSTWGIFDFIYADGEV